MTDFGNGNFPGGENRMDVDTPMVFNPVGFKTDNGGDPDVYLRTAKELVQEKYDRDIADLEKTPALRMDEIFVVWFTKVLQNWKALVSTDRTDGRYYELTHDGDKGVTYVDMYVKLSNEAIYDEDR